MQSKALEKSMNVISYDAGKLEVNDFFNYATKSKDVFAGSTPRTETILVITKSRLYLISDAIQQ